MASIHSQRPPSGLMTFLLGIACLAIFALLIVVWIKASAKKTDLVRDERGAGRIKKRLELEKDWEVKLQTAAWVDKEKGVAQVPIDDAIRAVVAESKTKQAVKTEIKVPPPLPPFEVDPKSTEPPPPALPSAPQGADVMHFANLLAPPAPAVVPTPATPPAPTIPTSPGAPVPPAPANPPAPVPPAPAVPPPQAAPSSAQFITEKPARPPLINFTEKK